MKFHFLRLITRLLSLVPSRILNGLSYPLGRLAWVISTTKRNSTLKNLAACYPQMSAPQRLKLGRESMRHYVANALEIGMSWHGTSSRFLRLFEEHVGLEHLQAALNEGRGVLVLAPHFGSWELLSHRMGKDHEIAIMYKPGSFEAFDARHLASRKRFGVVMVPADRAGLKVVYNFLNSARLVALLADQEPSAGQGRFAPFYGIPALTAVLAPRLVRRTGCRVIFAVCRRAGKGRFQVHILPADESIYSPDLDESLAALNRGVQRCVELDPAQYLWAYKRFKTRPAGEPRFYGRKN